MKILLIFLEYLPSIIRNISVASVLMILRRKEWHLSVDRKALWVCQVFCSTDSTTDYIGPMKGCIRCNIDFSCALTSIGKNVFGTIHLKGDQTSFLYSPSLSWQRSLSPAFLGGTYVVAQEKGRFLDHGIMNSECKLIEPVLPCSTGNWCGKKKMLVFSRKKQKSGSEVEGGSVSWWSTWQDLTPAYSGGCQSNLMAYLSSEQITSVAARGMGRPPCRCLVLVMASGLDLSPEFICRDDLTERRVPSSDHPFSCVILVSSSSFWQGSPVRWSTSVFNSDGRNKSYSFSVCWAPLKSLLLHTCSTLQNVKLAETNEAVKSQLWINKA